MDPESIVKGIATSAVDSAAVEARVPGKIDLLLPAVAGMMLYGAVTTSPAYLWAELMKHEPGTLFVYGSFVVLQLIAVIVPIGAWRSGKGTMLGYRFKLCLFLWITAYGIGFGILALPLWISKYV